MKLVQGHGINDMPKGWTVENEWNKRVYSKWVNMIYRCYNEEFHKTKNGERYKDCTVCERWLLLSNFVEDVPLIDGYDRERFLNSELELDKDIKSGGTNKIYVMDECLLTTHDENMKEAIRTRDNTYLQCRELSEETKQKMSKNNAKTMEGKFGSENPNSKRVAQHDKQTLELIKLWDSTMDVERELRINNSHISECCRGKRKSAGGFKWRYVEEEF